MKHPKIFFIAFLAWLLLIFCWYKSSEEESIKNNKLLINKIEFTGLIKSSKISGNHCFAIISVDIIKSNIPTFNADFKGKFFPYALRNGKAEIYTLLCTGKSNDLGDSIKLISNRRLLILSLKDGKKDTTDIHMITEDPDISFIQKNTSLK